MDKELYLSGPEASKLARPPEGMGSDRSMKGSRVTLVWLQAPHATLDDS